MSDLLVGVLSCDDACSVEGEEDRFGKRAVDACRDRGHDVVAYHVCPNDEECIEASLVEMCDVDEVAVVITVGGTGLGLTEVTPEATEAASVRLVPGVAEAMRAAVGDSDPEAMTSRAVAGQRGETLIVNLPACEGAFEASLDWLLARIEDIAEALEGGPYRAR